MRASQNAGTDTSITLPPTAPMAAKSAARARLVSGPAMAILSSARGESGSRASWATPPKTKSVMPRIGMP